MLGCLVLCVCIVHSVTRPTKPTVPYLRSRTHLRLTPQNSLGALWYGRTGRNTANTHESREYSLRYDYDVHRKTYTFAMPPRKSNKTNESRLIPLPAANGIPRGGYARLVNYTTEQLNVLYPICATESGKNCEARELLILKTRPLLEIVGDDCALAPPLHTLLSNRSIDFETEESRLYDYTFFTYMGMHFGIRLKPHENNSVIIHIWSSNPHKILSEEMWVKAPCTPSVAPSTAPTLAPSVCLQSHTISTTDEMMKQCSIDATRMKNNIRRPYLNNMLQHTMLMGYKLAQHLPFLGDTSPSKFAMDFDEVTEKMYIAVVNSGQTQFYVTELREETYSNFREWDVASGTLLNAASNRTVLQFTEPHNIKNCSGSGVFSIAAHDDILILNGPSGLHYTRADNFACTPSDHFNQTEPKIRDLTDSWWEVSLGYAPDAIAEAALVDIPNINDGFETMRNYTPPEPFFTNTYPGETCSQACFNFAHNGTAMKAWNGTGDCVTHAVERNATYAFTGGSLHDSVVIQNITGFHHWRNESRPNSSGTLSYVVRNGVVHTSDAVIAADTSVVPTKLWTTGTATTPLMAEFATHWSSGTAVALAVNGQLECVADSNDDIDCTTHHSIGGWNRTDTWTEHSNIKSIQLNHHYLYVLELSAVHVIDTITHNSTTHAMTVDGFYVDDMFLYTWNATNITRYDHNWKHETIFSRPSGLVTFTDDYVYAWDVDGTIERKFLGYHLTPNGNDTALTLGWDVPSGDSALCICDKNPGLRMDQWQWREFNCHGLLAYFYEQGYSDVFPPDCEPMTVNINDMLEYAGFPTIGSTSVDLYAFQTEHFPNLTCVPSANNPGQPGTIQTCTYDEPQLTLICPAEFRWRNKTEGEIPRLHSVRFNDNDTEHPIYGDCTGTCAAYGEECVGNRDITDDDLEVYDDIYQLKTATFDTDVRRGTFGYEEARDALYGFENGAQCGINQHDKFNDGVNHRFCCCGRGDTTYNCAGEPEKVNRTLFEEFPETKCGGSRTIHPTRITPTPTCQNYYIQTKGNARERTLCRLEAMCTAMVNCGGFNVIGNITDNNFIFYGGVTNETLTDAISTCHCDISQGGKCGRSVIHAPTLPPTPYPTMPALDPAEVHALRGAFITMPTPLPTRNATPHAPSVTPTTEPTLAPTPYPTLPKIKKLEYEIIIIVMNVTFFGLLCICCVHRRRVIYILCRGLCPLCFRGICCVLPGNICCCCCSHLIPRYCRLR